jgi:hypothetical protein
MRKVIDLQEYLIKINYDPKNSDLKIEVFDELGELIDFISILDDDNQDDEFNLN